ncbi:hypothetical protein BDV28DRAFT_43134 [Aspergillus coremiiformis]|uniref:Uncharacterized protein n=1 Tax=Aspergillus coremiiformis TaxID=138285 RepID=A0A5N6Z2X1_9EURO|nr:hypothetical protein BDV28DRAFT_43134 [Aspergillus coremiiformis]
MSIETFTTPSSVFVRHASRTNTRIPPIARRSASPLPCRMAMLSRDKLQREAAAKNPDLRRCVGHQRLLRRSIEVAHEDMKKAVASFQLEDSDDEDDGIPTEDFSNSPSPMIREQITKAVKAMVKRRAATPVHQKTNNSSTASLIRLPTKNDSRCDMSSSKPVDPFYNTPSVTTKRRKPTTRFAFTRRLWSSSGQSVPTIAS